MSSEPPLPPYVPPDSPPRWFPSFPPPQRKRPLHGDIAMKVLIVSAATAGVSFGLCSIAALGAQVSGKARIFIGLGAGGFFIGSLGLVGSLIWLLISAIVDRNQR